MGELVVGHMLDIVAVTGAAGALGTEVAKTLANRGHPVALLDSERSRERLEALSSSLGHACAVAGDLADASTWQTAIEKIERELGARPKLAALIAGAWQGGSPVHASVGSTGLDAMMHANVDTAYQGLRALLPYMVKSGAGAIVLVGSRAAVQPETSAGAAEYAASKAAVVALGQAVATEVLEHGVRINAILPSTLDTPANRAAMPHADTSKWVSLASAAQVIAFLLSSEAADISGAALPVYGKA